MDPHRTRDGDANVAVFDLQVNHTTNRLVAFTHGRGAFALVASAAISVTTASQDFGSVAVGSSADRTFTVQNAGSGTLSGSASTAAPFSILSGSPYSLTAGRSQVVTVRFSPTSAGTFGGSVNFTGGGGAATTVTGVGVAAGPSLTVSPTTVAPGGTMTATWSGIGAPTPTDWIGLYAQGAADAAFVRLDLRELLPDPRQRPGRWIVSLHRAPHGGPGDLRAPPVRQ